MSSRSAKLVNAALCKRDCLNELASVPSSSGIQNKKQETSSEEDWQDFDSDDSVIDKDYKLPKKSQLNSSSSDSESDFIPCLQLVQHKTIAESPEQSDTEINQVQLTKKGNMRKRKHFDISLKERKRQKEEEKRIHKYFAKPGCSENICKKKCSGRFSEDFRKIINNNFWKMTWKEQKYFFLCNTNTKKPGRPKNKENEIYEGDLFEKYEDIENSLIWEDAGSENSKLQRENRAKISSIADWIIPGHGPKFKVTDKIRKVLKEQAP